MVHWFSTNERGLVVSTWNVSHNVGGALVANLALLGVTLTNDWGAKFYFNAIVAAIVAVGVVLAAAGHAAGRPACRRSRSIATTIRPTTAPTTSAPSPSARSSSSTCSRTATCGRIAFANAFVYFVRYGVVNWIPTYLETAKGFSFQQSSLGWSLYEYAAIPGTIACGWMSDGGSRAGARRRRSCSWR